MKRRTLAAHTDAERDAQLDVTEVIEPVRPHTPRRRQTPRLPAAPAPPLPGLPDPSRADRDGVRSVGTDTERLPVHTLGPGDVIGERYELHTTLGEGGFGQVFAAHDRATGEDVAVKLLREVQGHALEDFYRETATLRLLRLPGVLPVLDNGTHNGEPFLVTRLIDGRHFPGTPAGGPVEWDAIEQLSIALLEALERVHTHGVVHRDLKPSNVLVGDDGRPVILDFGLAQGNRVVSVGGRPRVVGTPLYLSPEQAMGRPCDARSDLYAVGVMLYEALTTTIPHDMPSLHAVMRAKVKDPAPPVAARAIGVPANVANAVDRMLERMPASRPRSAAEAAEMLRGGRRLFEVPWLGDRAPLEQAIERAAQGEMVTLALAPGSTGTRCLRELLRVAEPLARPAIVTATAPPTTPRAQGSAANKPLLYIGHPQSPPSTDALKRLWRHGGIVRLVPHGAPADLRIGTVTEDDLRALFTGPEPVIHAREDGARLLSEACGGVLGRVQGVLEQWVRAGYAARDGDRFAMSLDALDRLRDALVPAIVERESNDVPDDDALATSVGPPATDAYRSIALSTDIPAIVTARENRSEQQRVAALLRTGKWLQAGMLALAWAARERRAGRLRVATMAARAALDAARRLGDPDAERDALVEMIKIAAQEQTLRPLELITWELTNTLDGDNPLTDALVRLTDAMRLARFDDRGGPRSLASSATLPRFDDEELNAITHGTRCRAATTAEQRTAALADAEHWATSTGDASLVGRVLSWRGVMSYVEGDFARAAELHRRSAAATEGAHRRAALLNELAALQQVGDPLGLAERALELAREVAPLRVPAIELSALLRYDQALYRARRFVAPDPERVEIALRVGLPGQIAQSALLCAALYLRAGTPALGCTWSALAAREFARIRFHTAQEVARELAMLGVEAGAAMPALPDAVAHNAISSDFALQAQALRHLRAHRRFAVPPGADDVPIDVLSAHECALILALDAGG